jgi:hypothetical protein
MPAPQDEATVDAAVDRQAVHTGRGHEAGRRLVALVGSNAVFTAVLVGGAVLRLLTMLAYRPAMEYVQDSFDYLGDARQLTPGLIRPLGYPLFLRALSPLHKLALVPLAQHALALGMGLLIYVLLRRLGVRPTLAAVGAVPMLLDPYQVYVEQFVMAETLYEALTLAALAAVLWRGRPTTRQAACAGVLVAAAGLTRVVGVFLLGPLLLYLLVRRAGWTRVVAAAAGAGILLGGYALWFRAEHGGLRLQAYAGYWLAGRVAPFADCEGLRLPALERPLCDPRPVRSRPGSDWYVWNPASPLRRPDVPPGTDREAVAGQFARRIILHQPLDYLGTVGRDLLHFAAPGRYTGTKDNPVQTWQFRTSFRPVPWHPEFPPADPYVNQWTWPGDAVSHFTVVAAHGFDLAPVGPRLDHGLASFLRAYQRTAYFPGPALVLSHALALAGALAARRAPDRDALWAGVLLAACGVVVLVGPAATAVFDYRYALASLPFLPPAGVVGCELLIRRRRSRRTLPAAAAEPPPAGHTPVPDLSGSRGGGIATCLRAGRFPPRCWSGPRPRW